jgi:hypothetical protein
LIKSGKISKLFLTALVGNGFSESTLIGYMRESHFSWVKYERKLILKQGVWDEPCFIDRVPFENRVFPTPASVYKRKGNKAR